MYVLRIHRNNKLLIAGRDLNIELTRSFMSLFANANKGSNTTAFKPQDFFKVSYDKVATEVEERPLSWKEAKALLGSKIKKTDGG